MSVRKNLAKMNELPPAVEKEFIGKLNETDFSDAVSISAFEAWCEGKEIPIPVAQAWFHFLTFFAEVAAEAEGIEAGIESAENNLVKTWLPDDAIESAWNRTKLQVETLRPFLIERKARDLQSVAGELDQVKFVCDARPVFSFERIEIRKWLIRSFGKISLEDGTELLFETNLEGLNSMKIEIERAIKKLNMISESIEARTD